MNKYWLCLVYPNYDGMIKPPIIQLYIRKDLSRINILEWIYGTQIGLQLTQLNCLFQWIGSTQVLKPFN